MNYQESINLVSSYADREGVSGPGKVLENLIKGLHKINQSYVVNRALDTTPYLWVQSDFCPLIDLPTEVFSLLGPNLAVLPGDLPGRRPFERSVYLQPSDWTVRLWIEEGFDRCALKVWPVGIDTEQFKARPSPTTDAPVLLYYKKRSSSDLTHVENLLRERGLPFLTLSYGQYSQNEYIELLRSHAFVVWLGCHESQGIALQEALAMDVPVLVADARSLFDERPPTKGLFPQRLRSFRTTSAPYFDSRCGLVVDDLTSLGDALVKMQAMPGTFRPREYVLENLSLEGQARRFVDLFSEVTQHHDGVTRRRRQSSADRRYIPARATEVRAKVSLKGSAYARKIRGIFE